MTAPTDVYTGLGMYCVKETEITHWEYVSKYRSTQYFNNIQRIINHGNLLYAVKSENNTDSRLLSIDASCPKYLVIKEEAQAGDQPVGLTRVLDKVHVANLAGPTVQRFTIANPDLIFVDLTSPTTSLAGIVDVVNYGNYIYCACSIGVVRVHKDTLAIVNASASVVGGSTWGAVSADGSTYYGVGNGRIRYWDISDAGVAPVYIGETIALQALNIKVKSNWLYVHANNAFYIYDITVPSAPVLRSSKASVDFGGSGGLDIAGNYAFVCCQGVNKVLILNIKNLDDLVITQTLVSGTDLPGMSAPVDIVMYKNYGYIAVRASDEIIVIGPPVVIKPMNFNLYNTLISFVPDSLWHYNGKGVQNDVIPDTGTTGRNMVVGGATTANYRLGPDNGVYPEYGNGTRTGNFNAWAQTSVDDYAGVYTTGMTILIVMMFMSGTSGGSLFRKSKTATTDSAEEILFFGTRQFGARTSRAGFNLAANSINQVSSTSVNAWHIFEVYYPPGNSFGVLYKDGLLVTDLGTNNFGPRGDHGVGIITVGGDRVSGSADCQGWYAMGMLLKRGLSAGERTAYRNAGIEEGWIT